MIEYTNIPEEEFEKVFSNIEDVILHYPYSCEDNNFTNSYCDHCGIIFYIDIPFDVYKVNNLFLCSKCYFDIQRQHAKRGIEWSGIELEKSSTRSRFKIITNFLFYDCDYDYETHKNL